MLEIQLFNASTDNALIPSQMSDDQIVINNWLAEDLGAKVGDKLSVILPENGESEWAAIDNIV